MGARSRCGGPLAAWSSPDLRSLAVTGSAKSLGDLSPEASRDLLRVLMSPSHVRADVIRQFHERGDEGMVEALTQLEADDLLRFQVIERLRRELR